MSFKFLRSVRRRIALFSSAKFIWVLAKFIVSETDSFRIFQSLSASFWTVFVEPDGAPPVHAKFSGAKLLCF